MESSEDSLMNSKNGKDRDLSIESSAVKEGEVLGEKVKEEKEDMDKDKGVEKDNKEEEAEMDREKEVEMDREKEVEVEKELDPWNHSHGRLPCWWWITALTLGPILLIVRVLATAVIVIFRCALRIPSLLWSLWTKINLLLFSFILVKLTLLGNVDLDQPLVGWRRVAQVKMIMMGNN